MKKFTFFIITIAFIILLGGCIVNSNKSDFDDETIKKAKNTAESYLKNNFKNINSIEFNEDYSNPMGGLMIRGTVNGNNKANFSIDIDIEAENQFNVGSIGKGKDFPERKEECKEKSCDY
ncbi:DUF1433 domain-containing protein [Virgibacillus salexigens]|uniref:DUF1433 domain-containing protein n=1 Tax=Virgibacillus massiliensis TaxID=1462526 RepID=A0A024QIA4_9BACI|nr:DUF1433 domain-containing protein [Virgibacillus massiliensis]CDQ41952.1 hypothetical protein BN990_04331 [Virgibacillus massiliensis]